MRKCVSLLVSLLAGAPAFAEGPTLQDELRAEIARLKESLARAEAVLARAEASAAVPAPPVPAAAGGPATPPSPALPEPAPSPAPGAPPPVADAKPAAPSPARPGRPPAMNTPPKLPASTDDAFKKAPPRIDVLLQARYDHFADKARANTFFIRKAEVGLKGHVIKDVDFSLEIDLARVQANDPYRRTYIRYSGFKHLHLKAGMEKPGFGLEELTSSSQIPFVDRAEVSDRFSAAEEVGIFAESNWDRAMFQASLTNGGRRLYRDDNRNKVFVGRAVFALHPRLSLGAATMQGKVGAQSVDRKRYNVEAKYGSNNIQGAQGEYYRSKDAEVWSDAFYAQAYWAFPVKSSWMTHLMPTVRYEYVDRDDGSVASELRLLTVGGGILFDENKSRFMVNWLKDTRSDSPRRSELRAQYQVAF